uniref:Polynucleotide adenylyltransferase n=1 Tax=Meloidogyne javanica TaxID=6303 RepID=A0A915N595_MELJA
MVGDKIEDLEKIAKVLGLEFDPADFEEKNNESDYFDIESKSTSETKIEEENNSSDSENGENENTDSEELSQNSLESEIEEESQLSTKSERSFSVEGECSTKPSTSVVVENDLMIKDNLENKIQNCDEIIILKNTREESSSSSSAFDQKLEKNNWKTITKNNGEITEQKYFDNNDWMDYRTNFLRKIPGRVSIINLEFLGQQFDLILVVLPPQIFLELNENNLSVKIFDGIIANFIELVGGYSTFNEKSKHLGMLLALSGYRANLRILKLINEKDKKNFQLIVLILKVWAKMGNVGDGVNSSEFLVDIVQCQPKKSYCSVPMILEVNTDYPNIREYLDWNIPNEHINRSKQIPLIFHQDLKENLYPIWPIITPGFPTQNLNFNMNISTAKIIQETMKIGWVFC